MEDLIQTILTDAYELRLWPSGLRRHVDLYVPVSSIFILKLNSHRHENLKSQSN
jgi:hypothetical protein